MVKGTEKKELEIYKSLLYDIFRENKTEYLKKIINDLKKIINIQLEEITDKETEDYIKTLNKLSSYLAENEDNYYKSLEMITLYNKYKNNKWYDNLNPLFRRQGGTRKRSKTTKRVKTIKKRKWSNKYKKSINCRDPKGFSQKQYCKSKKRR